MQKKRALLGQLQGTGLAQKQWRAKLRLQVLNLAAEGRLGDAEPGGGTGEVQLFCHRDEIANVAQFHWGGGSFLRKIEIEFTNAIP